ncbi:MAG: alpha-L-rhamnosidase C-terminal domain-containing protein [Puia sp.]
MRGAALETGYGKLSVYWKVNNGNFSMDVEIPSNTTASVFIPASTAASIMENGKPLSDEKRNCGIKGRRETILNYKTGSGSYHFSTEANKIDSVVSCRYDPCFATACSQSKTYVFGCLHIFQYSKIILS